MPRQRPPTAGQTLETAIWLSGVESDEHIARWGDELPALVTASWPRLKLKLSPFRHAIKYPGDERVPPVPDHIHGLNVRLLVAECDVVSVEEITEDNSFIGQLEKKDLKRLRELTRASYTGPGVLADWQCDYIIESMGPESAARAVKGYVDNHVTLH